MDFKEKLNEYIEQLGCTSKELAQASGLSAATISRYRSGDRLPQRDSENYDKLIAVMLAQDNVFSLALDFRRNINGKGQQVFGFGYRSEVFVLAL